MLDAIFSYAHWIAATAGLIFNVWASLHVVLYKRDTRSAIGWVGVIWLTPLVGSVLYYLLGINRIHRKAYRLRKWHRPVKRTKAPAHGDEAALTSPSPLAPLVRLGSIVTGEPLFPGNRVEPLQNGDQAYPAMLQAIHNAKQSVSLTTYIFGNDRVGLQFVEALQQAKARGVEVRVMIDDIGVHYSWPTIQGPLRRAGIPLALFLPALLPLHFYYANMRSHRKVLVADGRVGFTGGMNISALNQLAQPTPHPVQDMHFRIEGPVVALLQEVFADDWAFCTGELLEGDRWFPELEERGSVAARGVTSGPDANFEKLEMMYLGALACARTRVQIVTPYFLPDWGLIAALNTAALRGVQVDILLPSENNLRTVQWASTAQLPEILSQGCRVWLTAPPFDHTKLVLVDGQWTFLGSANWDARSLQLNFEFNLECYDAELTAKLEAVVQGKLARARRVTLADVNQRSFPVRLRDGIARLMTPYL